MMMYVLSSILGWVAWNNELIPFDFFIKPSEFFFPSFKIDFWAHKFLVGVAKHNIPQIVLLKSSHQNFVFKTLNSKGNQMQKKCFQN